MNPLERLDPEELIKLSDEDFQDTVQQKARAMVAEAMETIQTVMVSSDDDQARLTAATKTLDLAGAREANKALPFGVSEEVFAIALAGLLKLPSLGTGETLLLRDVTPAEADPRMLSLDDSPLNASAPKAKHLAPRIVDNDDSTSEILEDSLNVEE
jgi:hypothetical protein